MKASQTAGINRTLSIFRIVDKKLAADVDLDNETHCEEFRKEIFKAWGADQLVSIFKFRSESNRRGDLIVFHKDNWAGICIDGEVLWGDWVDGNCLVKEDTGLRFVVDASAMQVHQMGTEI